MKDLIENEDVAAEGTELHPRDRRISNRLLQYWEELRGVHDLPLEDHIDPHDPFHLAEIWENCFLLQIRDIKDDGDFNYTFLGSEIKKAYGLDLDGTEESHLISPHAPKLVEKYKKVIETKMPITDEGEFYNQKGKLVKYRQSLVPFGSDHNTVSAILGGMKYRIF